MFHCRMAVMVVFPAFMLPVCVIKSVILFNRGNKIDKKVSETGITEMSTRCEA